VASGIVTQCQLYSDNMSHITRRAAAEQRSNKKLTPEQKLTRKVTTGVTKSRQVPNDKQVGEKWTKKHNNVRKVEDKKEVLGKCEVNVSGTK